MPGQDFDQRLTSWMWIAASGLITFLTYSIRFRRPISRVIVSTPEAVRALRWVTAFASLRRVVQLVRRWISFLWVLGCVVGFVVGLWLVATHPRLSSDARIGIGTALGVVQPMIYRAWAVKKRLARPKALPQLILAFVVAAAWGVALWKLATTQALETNAKIGVALGIFGVQFSSSGASSVPAVLVGVLRPGNDLRVSTIGAVVRLMLWTIHGIVLWKLFGSPALTDGAKIGIAIGVCGGVLYTVAAVRFNREDGTFLRMLSFDLLIMSFWSTVSVAVWKLSTSQPTDGVKVVIGIGVICIICGWLSYILWFGDPDDEDP